MSGSPLLEKIVIVGAGFAGRALLKDIRGKFPGSQVVAFLDDDPQKSGVLMEGLPVYGPMSKDSKIPDLDVDEAIIAIPTATKGQLSRIVDFLRVIGIPQIRILPAVSQIVDGEAHFILTRELDPQDLLGRNPVYISLKKSLGYLRGKRVLITGAGGSIGSELSRQLLSGGASRIYLFGHGENSIVSIHRELLLLQEEGIGEAEAIIPIIGDIKDRSYMLFLLSRLRADVVFHCAAHKHVPLMEENPVEVIHNNVFGTRNLVDASKSSRVSRFVLVSTDKAVAPASLYGISKKITEDLVLAAGGKDSDFLVVRFGNVLGSRGSILPLFRKQIENGGPLTITHPEATRFFMTIPEAVSLVLQAGGTGENAQVYVLDMGAPVKIMDLAKQMIRFYALGKADQIAIKTIGLRPGEKLHERLWEEGEELRPTSFPRINQLVAKPSEYGLEEIMGALEPVVHPKELEPELYRNRHHLRRTLKEYFPDLMDKSNEPKY